MTRINIAFGATNNWLNYTAVTISSILTHASEDDEYHFYILSDEFRYGDKQRFYSLDRIKNAKYHFKTMNEDDFEGAIHDWLGVSSSYRLKLSSMVKQDKILYLDSDILVFGDIKELYSIDIPDYYIAAVEDKCSSIMKTRIPLADEQTFYNAGVLLMNLKQFRKNKLEKIIFEKLRESAYYTDQDVINDICRDKIFSLPLKYNIMGWGEYPNREDERDLALQEPLVYHFVLKPWTDNTIPYADKWYEYYDEIVKRK